MYRCPDCLDGLLADQMEGGCPRCGRDKAGDSETPTPQDQLASMRTKLTSSEWNERLRRGRVGLGIDPDTGDPHALDHYTRFFTEGYLRAQAAVSELLDGHTRSLEMPPFAALLEWVLSVEIVAQGLARFLGASNSQLIGVHVLDPARYPLDDPSALMKKMKPGTRNLNSALRYWIITEYVPSLKNAGLSLDRIRKVLLSVFPSLTLPAGDSFRKAVGRAR